jgi:hypothetical protein
MYVKNTLKNNIMDLYTACYTGDISEVNRLISLGYVDFNSGLSGACAGNWLILIDMMILHGADKCDNCKIPIVEH